MNYSKDLIFLLLLTSFSCKKLEKSNGDLIPDHVGIQNEVKNHPEIEAPEIKQLNYTQIALNSLIYNGVNKYEYYPNGKIKEIVGLENQNFRYDENKVTTSKETIYLDQNGLAKEIQTEGNLPTYYFKNGFLIRINNFWPKWKYSKTGNLVSYDTENVKISYEYTEFPNNIRQEIFSRSPSHLSKRDLYLGKFSTNLLKKAIINESIVITILNFSYEFDDQNRVKKMVIDRDGNSKFEYLISY